MLDIILKNGKIVDGTGNPWFYGDVGIKNDQIVLLGNVAVDVEATEIIDVKGKVIAPGFIDLHTHSDLAVFVNPLGEDKLQQGVTTVVFGNCGLAPAPVSDDTAQSLKVYTEPIMGKKEGDWPWHTVGEYIDQLSKLPVSHNIATYVGNGALRIAVKGFEKSPLTTKERDQVKELLAEGLEAGAMGLTFGLLYSPEAYYSTEELTDICSVLGKYHGVLSTHIRGEGNSLIPSIKEVIQIAEATGISLNISHFKAAGKNNWGVVLDEAMGLITEARNRGLDVTCDVYPYSAGSTTIVSLLPPWSMVGGVEKAIERIKNPETRRKIYAELESEQSDWDNLVYSTGWDSVIVSSIQTQKNQELVGKSIAQIATQRGQNGTDCALDLMVEEGGNIAMIFFHMSEEDVKKVLTWDKSFVISDSLYSTDGIPHPRLYGTVPRLFAKYVREDKVLSLEQAVRKVTSFPAQRLKLSKRGLLVPGYVADIVVFDPDTIQDKATYMNPRQYPEGIDMVFVAGKKTIAYGKHLGTMNGQFLKRS